MRIRSLPLAIFRVVELCYADSAIFLPYRVSMFTENSWKLEVFYDGDCPLCRREINWLRQRDFVKNNVVLFTDIADPGFDARSIGKSKGELMDQIHGRTSEGEWLIGVSMFRRLYALVGLKWLSVLISVPGLSRLSDLVYSIFARYRLALTGRSREAVSLDSNEFTRGGAEPACNGTCSSDRNAYSRNSW
jgi:predicted DCC family thiol-disulfide oxidoreductase YuxK